MTDNLLKDAVNARNRFGGQKYPNLKELYAFAKRIEMNHHIENDESSTSNSMSSSFNGVSSNPVIVEEMKGHHNALFDVINLKEAIGILAKRGIFKLF